MFIKSICISNFKGFIGEDHTINFNIPNGNSGSGLNIFVGENNSGKSTVFEAIDFLRNGTKDENICLIKSKLDNGSQPNDSSVEMVFCGDVENTITNFVQNNKQNAFLDLLDNKELKAKRDSSSIKKLWLWNKTEYTNPSGIDAPFKSMFETNFIWADTNPNNEASFGATTLCGLLLKEIAKSHINSEEYSNFLSSFHQVFNSSDSELRKQIAIIEEKVQRIFTDQFGQANIYFQFEELKIDSFFKNTSIFINDGVDIPMSEKGNGMQRSLALALLQVYAEELAVSQNTNLAKPFYLFIDEPEICLHPKGQTKLLKSLLEISKTKQVFLTTHSPYFLSTPELKHIGLFIFTKNGISNAVENSSSTPMFPWSPTWGEINFKAYKLPTVELHNELYGKLQSDSGNFTEKMFEQWLISKGLQANKKWTRECQGSPKTPQKVTLQTFIRNHIHHPENQTMKNNLYTESELFQSIQEMINLL
ncbi:hypothetical protein BKK49_08785 [Rodentibacter rarus]|nr:hypothetical protein BKK49_08785 [Rodentibacter rarus]